MCDATDTALVWRRSPRGGRAMKVVYVCMDIAAIWIWVLGGRGGVSRFCGVVENTRWKGWKSVLAIAIADVQVVCFGVYGVE